MKSKHDHVKFACDQCDYQTKRKRYLKTHLKFEHGSWGKFIKSCRQQSNFWTEKSLTLDEDSFEKLVEEECSLETFSQDLQKDADFKPYLNMFKKCSSYKFCYLTTKQLKDNEYKKLENIFMKSEKINYLVNSDYSRNKFTLVGIFDH